MEERMVGRFRITKDASGCVRIQHIDSFRSVLLYPIVTNKIDIAVCSNVQSMTANVSVSALDTALNMLKGKDDVVPSETEDKINPAQLRILIGECRHRHNSFEDETWRCSIKSVGGDGKRPPCDVITLEDWQNCKGYSYSGLIVGSPEKSGE